MKLEKYSFGVGDRFGVQAAAQLQAFIKANDAGIAITPVWNKSHREHSLIGSTPQHTRQAVDRAIDELNWPGAYHVDADHINFKNVDPFIPHSDFFTIDIAEFIGKPPTESDTAAFMKTARPFIGKLAIPGIDRQFEIDDNTLRTICGKFLAAVLHAGAVYRHIVKTRQSDDFITEVSLDETDAAQTPLEMFFILAMLAWQQVPAQTIAPKFTGEFHKGVDYIGDIARFETEFRQDLCVIRFAVERFDLPKNLKISIHSGSDKFSLYPPIRRAMAKFDAGIHIKTAGTTWLEELIGLAEASNESLAIAKEIYTKALGRFDELCAPYATVVDIDKAKLPDPDEIQAWTGKQFADALRHRPDCPDFNPHFRQLLHLSYKIAAEMGQKFMTALSENAQTIARNVTENIYNRHIAPLFIDH